jgi:hypothetical protein
MVNNWFYKGFRHFSGFLWVFIGFEDFLELSGILKGFVGFGEFCGLLFMVI